MSSPYNNFIVNDVAVTPVPQPYVNSNVEVGYFSSPALVTPSIINWYSMNTVVLTTNGNAIQGSSTSGIAGLNILNSGIYKIHLSFFPVNESSNQSAIKFNFGTTRQVNNPTSNTVNAFGGKGNSNNLGYGMYTFDHNYNYTYPGIISWLGNGYNNVNTVNSGFTKAAGELNFSYNADASSGTGGGQIFAGICTTQITFILNGETTIYLNVSANQSGVVMGNCYFTLELISSIPQSFIYTWTPNNIGAFNWQAIASDSTGTNLAAVVNSGYIYTSSNSGTSWIQQNGPPNTSWQSIASSEDGTRLAAVSTAVVYTGLYNMLTLTWTWTSQTAALPSGITWGGIASDSSGTILAAAGSQCIYRGVFDGSIWTWTQIYNLAVNWRAITSSGDGTILAAVVNGGGIYTGVYNGSTWTWTPQTTTVPVTAGWRSITSSKDGTRLAAVIFGGSIYTGYDNGSGFVWTIQTNTGLPVTANWTSITSSYDGKRLAATSYGGYIYTATLTNNVYTWSLPTYPILNWIAIASNETGENLAALVTNGSNMYIGTLTSNNTSSIKPYNNFGVNDLAIPPIRQPYVNSIVEVGYFSPNSTVKTWYSMNTNLITNNGIATTASVTAQTNGSPSVNSVTGLQIKNAGIYKLTISVFPALTNPNSNGTISYNFGYVAQWNTAQTNPVNSFGGSGSSPPLVGGFGLYTFDNNINKNIPGIISWLPTGYTGGTFTKFSATNELNYTYNYNTSGQATGSNYYIDNGICTSEMTFFVTDGFVTGQQNIFLNICGSNTVTMSNCYFTLELISTQHP